MGATAVVLTARSLPAPSGVTGATLFFDDVLNIDGPTQLILADALFQTAGQYTVFDYSAVGSSFPGGQAALDNYVWPYIDSSALTKTTPLSLADDTVNKRVYLTMGAGVVGNGTVYFDSSVSFPGPTEFYLSAAVASSPGTYTIVEAVGAITGESNIKVIPLKSGLVVYSVAKVGNRVQAVLV